MSIDKFGNLMIKHLFFGGCQYLYFNLQAILQPEIALKSKYYQLSKIWSSLNYRQDMGNLVALVANKLNINDLPAKIILDSIIQLEEVTDHENYAEYASLYSTSGNFAKAITGFTISHLTVASSIVLFSTVPSSLIHLGNFVKYCSTNPYQMQQFFLDDLYGRIVDFLSFRKHENNHIFDGFSSNPETMKIQSEACATGKITIKESIHFTNKFKLALLQEDIYPISGIINMPSQSISEIAFNGYDVPILQAIQFEHLTQLEALQSGLTVEVALLATKTESVEVTGDSATDL